jgi:hypothetical protein
MMKISCVLVACVAACAATAVRAQTPHFPVYCNNGPDKKPPYYCHAPPLPASCNTNADCQTPWYNTSYCMNDDTKHPPYKCYQELPPKCKVDSDCERKTKTKASFAITATEEQDSLVVHHADNGEGAGGDAHCFEITVTDPKNNEYWAAHGYQYPAVLWPKGPCDHKKYNFFNRKESLATGVEMKTLGINKGSASFSKMLTLAPESAPIVTNICSLDWNYCPRDPGCKTYTMSVHNVVVHSDSAPLGKPVKAEDLKAGDNVTVVMTGETTITSVSASGSYRVYALSGGNVATGVLTDALTLNGKQFTFKISFTLASGNFKAPWFEFGIDIFQKKSGSDEGVCVEIEDIEYLTYEKEDKGHPFQMECKDNGDGTFTPQITPLQGHPIPAPKCVEKCDLDWYYCPRDPGCATYTMSVKSVEVDVMDATGLVAGDKVILTVNGTTTMKTVPTSGSYRIYALSGGNEAAGLLSDTLRLLGNGAFSMRVPFDITAASFEATKGWTEFGLDVFQKQSGSDEGVCIEVANMPYINYEEHNVGHPFVTYCSDNGNGTFTKHTQPEVVFPVDCELK